MKYTKLLIIAFLASASVEFHAADSASLKAIPDKPADKPDHENPVADDPSLSSKKQKKKFKDRKDNSGFSGQDTDIMSLVERMRSQSKNE